MQYVTLARDRLAPDADQPRRSMDDAELQQLALSVRQLGLLQTLIVYQHADGYIIVDGHRRYAAAGLAGLTELAALVLDEKPDADTLLLTQLAANCVRSDLKPSERALAYQRLKESRRWSHAELAKAMHISKSKVTQTLSFLALSEEARTLLDAGQLPESTAYAIAREPDSDRRKVMLRAAVNGDLKRDEANRRVKKKSAAKMKHRRCVFQLSNGEISIAVSEELEIPGCVALLQQLIRHCRAAAKDGLNVETFARVLADRRNNQSTSAAGESNRQQNAAAQEGGES